MQRPDDIEYRKWLFVFALLTTVVAVCLILAGATVTSTGSGDAVPDWPLSYGSLTPPMIGGIFYEHGHRLIAGLTGILVAILAFWMSRVEVRRWVRWMSYGALIAVIVQATLGGLRVLLVSTEGVQDAALAVTGGANIQSTKIAVAITHATLAQSILCMLFVILVATSRSWLGFIRQSTGIADSQKTWRDARIMVGLVFAQLVIAAMVRHTGAGLVIPDFPLAFGSLIPPFWDLPHNPNAPFPVSETAFTLMVTIQFLHRLLAFVILFWVFRLFMNYNDVTQIGMLTRYLLILTVIQITLGAMNIWTEKSVFSTVPHVVVGALILACSVVIATWAWRFTRQAMDAPGAVANGAAGEAELSAAESRIG